MEVKSLSSDQMRKYCILWKKFADKQFKFEQAKKILQLTETNSLVTLHRIKSRGWLTSEKDKKNLKRSLYRLISPNKAVAMIK